MCEEDTQQVDDMKIGFKVFQLVLALSKLWKQEHQIDGIHALNDDLIENENEFSMTMEWVMPPKVVRRKKHFLGQMMLQVKAELSAIQLFQGQHVTCNKKN